MQISEISESIIRYQQLQFGLDWAADSNHNAKGISFPLKGEQHFQVDAKHADHRCRWKLH